jgi:hypothetical protein
MLLEPQMNTDEKLNKNQTVFPDIHQVMILSFDASSRGIRFYPCSSVVN